MRIHPNAQKMVSDQIISRGVNNREVLTALCCIDRSLFVPDDLQDQAFEDYPLPIGEGQTISQPYIVALMSELLEIKSHHRVLEIGTGSGYQSAVLALLCSELYSIENIETLYNSAKKRLLALGLTNIYLYHGNGYGGIPQAAPYDRIITTCAPEKIPNVLLQQLTPQGILVSPEGKTHQYIIKITNNGISYKKERHLAVRFVPMVDTE